VSYKQHDAAEKYKRHRQEYCSSLTGSAEQKKACTEEGTSARDYLPWWYALIAWPEGIGAWAVIATGLAIVWQSWATAGVLEHMRSESRARIEIRPGDIVVNNEEEDPYWQEVGGLYWFIETYISLRNVGKSSAYIVRCSGEAFVLQSGELLEDRSFNGHSLDISSAVIEPSEKIACDPTIIEFDLPIKEVVDLISQNEIYLIFRGFVEYETQGTQWRRDFCYWWIDNQFLRRQESGFTFPPNTFERMRDGSWEKYPNQNNGEQKAN
jgi:hypothetical protein